MTEHQITCQQRDDLMAKVGMKSASVSSSLTNFVGGEVLDDRLPPHTATTWCDADGRDFSERFWTRTAVATGGSTEQ